MDSALQPIEGSKPDALPWAYRFFGSALLGRTTGSLPPAVRSVLGWAWSEARRNVRTGRCDPGLELQYGLRLAYGALKAEAATVRGPSEDAPPSHVVLVAASRLRHRQRAAALLRYGLGLDEAGTARIIGVRPAQAGTVCAGAIATMHKAIARPADIPRSLRRLGRDPSARATHERLAPVERLPRAVVRTLIAPPPGDAVPLHAVEQNVRRSPVETLIAAAPVATQQPAATTPSPVARPKRWSFMGRLAAAASIGMLFVWAVWPTHG